MKNETETKTNVHAQGAERVLRGQGCWLLVVRSVLWCVHLMDNRSTTRKARRREAKMRAETKPKKTREHRNEVVCFRSICIGLVFRGDPVWHRIAIYIVVSCPISCDITRYDISSINCIHIPNFWGWYRDIVSRRYISRWRTLFFAQLGALSLVHQDSKRNGYLAVALQKQWCLLGNICVRL